MKPKHVWAPMYKYRGTKKSFIVLDRGLYSTRRECKAVCDHWMNIYGPRAQHGEFKPIKLVPEE